MQQGINDPSLRIGTSGWHYKHWVGKFYPLQTRPADMLQWYLRHFDTVEINNSFYRLPNDEVVKAWVKNTPADFLFAVKASRYITHNRKLREPAESSAKFFKVIEGFGDKLGPILFQLPPSWSVNAERLADFLAYLPPDHQYAFEFRNPDWHVPEVYNILRRFNAAFCHFDIAGFQSPIELTADFAYVRLHGPGNAYQGKYSPAHLKTWAKRIEGWMREGDKVFVYFDNDQSGFAAENALELSQMISGRPLLKRA